MSNKYVLIELNLYGKGHYSNAEYEEIVFITPQDYIKYFGSGQSTEAETFEEYVENMWDGEEIALGELDGKHSEVYGDVEVDFWDSNRIAEYYSEQTNNSGDILLDKLAYMAKGNESSYEDREQFIDEIKLHVHELVESIGTKVEITVRVPKDKVEELNAFVEQLNK